MKNTLIEAEVVRLLRHTQGKQMQKDFAKVVGVSKQYLADIYSGRRSPGPAILKFLKLERVYRLKKSK